jgi:hypothetical protein
MMKFPGALLAFEGFPRALQNCHDFIDISCGPPKCAFNINVPDDEMMIEQRLG